MASVTYQHLLHDVALRMNALVGSLVATIDTTYDTAVLTDANFKSADWPLGSFRDAILMAVADFAWAIADTGGHPWRSFLADTTAPLANRARLPRISVGDNDILLGAKPLPIIGVWGVIRDAIDHTPLTEQPLDVVRRVNQETWRKYPLYFFKIDGRQIEHTRPTAEIECCVYDHSQQEFNFAANSNVPLPEVLRLGIASRAVSTMTKDGAFEGQAALYRGYSDDALMRIRAGLITLPAKTLPSPTVSQT